MPVELQKERCVIDVKNQITLSSHVLLVRKIIQDLRETPYWSTRPIQVCDRTVSMDVLGVPSLSHLLILGADFWRKIGIVPNLRS